MRELLDISSQRRIKILEILLNNKGWTNFATLANEVNSSERTIANDISVLKEHWIKHLDIEVSKKNGVRLKNQNIASIGLVFTDIFNDSIALRWIKDLLFHPDNTIEFYEDRLFTSRSVLARLLPKINNYLHTKGMVIQSKDRRYSLVGENEQYLRDFCASFLLELYGLNLEKFDLDIELSVLADIIISIMRNNSDSTKYPMIYEDDLSITYNIMFYIVSIVRENSGYNVSSMYNIENEIDTKNINYLVRQFPNIKAQNLNCIHEYIKNKFNGWDSKEEKEMVKQKIDMFCENFFSDISIFPDTDAAKTVKYVIQSIYFYTKLRPFKTSELFNRIYYFSLSINRVYPSLYKSAEKNLAIFSKETQVELSSHLSEFLFWICLLCPEITQIRKSYRALLISDFGKLHTNFLQKVISDFFNSNDFHFIKIDIAMYPYDLTHTELDNYDIIITTTPSVYNYHKKIVLISDYPTSDDFCEIFKSLNHEAMD